LPGPRNGQTLALVSSGLERIAPWLTLARMPPPPPRRSGGVLGAAPNGIASRAARTLDPFVVPPLPGWTLDRGTAWSIPASANGIQVIAGTLATLPLHRWRGAELTGDDTLVAQPDPLVPASATLNATIEDLVLFPYAYWIVLARDYRGFPSAARQVPADLVTDRLDVDGELDYADATYPAGEVIRFHAPTPGLLWTGRDVLRTAAMLEAAAQRYAGEPIPSGYLSNTGPVDLEDEEIDALLDTWAAARNARATAYLGPNTNYQATAFNAEQLQLTQSREHAAAAIAQLLNLPPRYVNAPTAGGASLTYSTLESARRDLVDLCLSQYMAAVCDRLTLTDVTPAGQSVRFALAQFYRADFGSLVSTGATAVSAGLMTVAEWRRLAGLPDTPADDTAAPPALAQTLGGAT
jgi:hypothetical protein